MAHELIVMVAQTQGVSTELSPVAVLWFGGACLALLAGTQLVRILKSGMFSTNFAKLYGLLFVAIMGTVLVFVNVDDESKAPAYTLLGTVAGYLAGRDKDRVSGSQKAPEKK